MLLWIYSKSVYGAQKSSGFVKFWSVISTIWIVRKCSTFKLEFDWPNCITENWKKFNDFAKTSASDKHANVDRWKKIRVITCLVYETYDRAGAF